MPRVRASPASTIVSLSKNINPRLVLVQPRKTRPFITEILLMGRKESNQTNRRRMRTPDTERPHKVTLSTSCSCELTQAPKLSILFHAQLN